MTVTQLAVKILDSMIGHLGLTATIEAQETDDGLCLQIFSCEKETFIGNDGDRLDDLQYLVNRILRRQIPDAARVKVDCEYYRSIQEDKLTNEVKEFIGLAKTQQKTYRLRPLNAYYRRLAYQVIAQDLGVSASSPEGEARLKRISISPK